MDATERDMRRFFAKAVLGEPFGSLGPCLIWTGYVQKNGYGSWRFNGRTRVAHRIAYEHFNGPIPDGLVLDHLCRVRNCVSPNHLEPVTYSTNSLRGETVVSDQANRTQCPQGHAYDEANTYWYRNKRQCKACRKRHTDAHNRKVSERRRIARELRSSP